MKYQLRENYEMMFNNIVDRGARYIYGCQIRSMVMGVSGGIDSAVTAVLANAICRKLKDSFDFECKLIGRVIPIESNKDEENERAFGIVNSFCDDYKSIDLTKLYKTLSAGLDMTDDFLAMLHKEWTDEMPFDVKVRNGNIKARLRMIQLYHLAHKYNGIVLSTDNLTELMLGFWTLHGDVGDLGFIQSLWKTEVYGLAKWMVDNGYGGENDALQACIDAVPTDGLGVTTSDFDQLGYKSYKEIDEKLLELVNLQYEHKNTSHLKDDPVVKRWSRTQFKRDNPCNLKRRDIVGFFEDTTFVGYPDA